MLPVAFTREQSRRVDQIAAEEFGFSGLVLMENAGRGVADVLCQ
jgi:NAD(P)H-hydrate epimerase